MFIEFFLIMTVNFPNLSFLSKTPPEFVINTTWKCANEWAAVCQHWDDCTKARISSFWRKKETVYVNLH